MAIPATLRRKCESRPGNENLDMEADAVEEDTLTATPGRRALVETRYGLSSKLTRRSSRLLSRLLVVLLIVLIVFSFHDSQKPEEARVMRGDVVRQQLVRRLGKQRNTDPRIWPGWAGIKAIYAFGDSQTDTGFNLQGPQPDRENPIGNPAFPGRTSSYRANYLGHMTASYNHTLIKTYNMANKYSPFFHNTDRMKMPSFGEQIDGKFLRRYGASTKLTSRGSGSGSWSQTESLFVFYVGADDIISSFEDGTDRKGAMLEENLQAYYEGLDKLYQAGARNFLILNYPQLENAPGIKDYGDRVGEGKAYWRLGATIVQYNARLAFMAHRFAEGHSEASVFVFNTHKLSLTVRLEATRFPETEMFTHLFGYCFPYADNHWWVETSRVNDPGCGGSLENYLWRDEFHYSEPMQKLIAKKITELLAEPSNRLPQEFY